VGKAAGIFFFSFAKVGFPSKKCGDFGVEKSPFYKLKRGVFW
jgi:hypothetical protein